jgi:hypothetical protein
MPLCAMSIACVPVDEVIVQWQFQLLVGLSSSALVQEEMMSSVSNTVIAVGSSFFISFIDYINLQQYSCQNIKKATYDMWLFLLIDF